MDLRFSVLFETHLSAGRKEQKLMVCYLELFTETEYSEYIVSVRRPSISNFDLCVQDEPEATDDFGREDSSSDED